MVTCLAYLLIKALFHIYAPSGDYGTLGIALFGALYSTTIFLDVCAIGQVYHLFGIIADKIYERLHPERCKKPRLIRVRRVGRDDYMPYDEWREGGWREGWHWDEDGNLVLPPEAVRELDV